jgi:GxxExxY protein
VNELHEPSVFYDAGSYKHSELTQQIIGIFYAVYNALGSGFLEKVYENALVIRLQKAGFTVAQQHPIKVYFDGVVVGEYFADLVVNDLIILEIKAVTELIEAHEAQLINYLKATPYEVGLLLNFGPKPQVVRKAYDNHRKALLKEQ